MDVLASLQNALDITAKLRALSKKVEDADFKMFLAELSSELADAKLDIANLKTRLADLQRENENLQAKLSVKESGKPTFMDGAYVFSGESGHFCTACFDTKVLKVRLTKLGEPFDDLARWQCPSCQALYS